MSTYLGQNFLIDSKVKHQIADKIKHFYEKLGAEQLIEIWPGKGAITKLIKDISPNFVIIEKDATLKSGLEELLQGKGTLIIDDVLRVEMHFPLAHTNHNLPSKLYIVGNLPYYITSPILRKFFNNEQPHIVGGLFMVQAEVGEKIREDATKKSYLYWLLNYAYQVEYLKTIPPKAFIPSPKVRSCLISIVKKAEVPDVPFERLVSFLDAFSPYSRKTLGKIAKMGEKRWNGLFIIPDVLARKRLEELSRKELEGILKPPLS